MPINWTNPSPEKRSHFARYMAHFSGAMTYQLFHDKKSKNHPPMILHDATPSQLIEYNRKGYGVFLTINETDGKGRKKKNIKQIRAVFADMDEAPVNLTPIMDYNPHMVVQSSPGKFHAYWFCTGVPVEGFSEVQKSVIHKFGSDPACKDESRVLRVPGFYHHKKIPQQVNVVHEHDYPPIEYNDLIKIFPPVVRKRYTGKQYKSATGDAGVFKGQRGTSAGDRNNHVMRIAGGAIKRGLTHGEVENEVRLECQACSPPIPEHETEKLVRQALRYCGGNA